MRMEMSIVEIAWVLRKGVRRLDISMSDERSATHLENRLREVFKNMGIQDELASPEVILYPERVLIRLRPAPQDGNS